MRYSSATPSATVGVSGELDRGLHGHRRFARRGVRVESPDRCRLQALCGIEAVNVTLPPWKTGFFVFGSRLVGFNFNAIVPALPGATLPRPFLASVNDSVAPPIFRLSACPVGSKIRRQIRDDPGERTRIVTAGFEARHPLHLRDGHRDRHRAAAASARATAPRSRTSACSRSCSRSRAGSCSRVRSRAGSCACTSSGTRARSCASSRTRTCAGSSSRASASAGAGAGAAFPCLCLCLFQFRH